MKLINTLKKFCKNHKWGLYYLLIVTFFALIYSLAWKYSEDTFIVHEELNLRPILNMQETLWSGENIQDSTPPILDLTSMQRKYISSVRKAKAILDKIEVAEADRKAKADKLRELLLIHSTSLQSNIDLYKNKSLAPVIEQQEELLNKIEQRVSSNKYVTNDEMALRNAIQVADMKVEYANLSLEIAQKEYDLASVVLEDVKKFADPEVLKQIEKLQNEKRQILESIESLRNELVIINREMRKDLDEWINRRANSLNYIDFLYYSIGVSTTTTFGEIVANSRLIRAVVSLQLILSIFVVAGFVNSVVNNKKE